MTEAMHDATFEEPERVEPDDTGSQMPAPSALESLVNALLDSGPEVAEHVVRAAQELLLAAQCVVDAAEHAVHEQQDIRRAAAARDADAARETTTRHLDLAE